ncbi:MAG: amino acid permease [Polyangiaceae bacterium]
MHEGAPPPDDMSTAGPRGDPRDDADARDLSRLGYAQELLRAMGGFSSFALSFSIISVLTGITTTYGVALAGGGPAALGLGWPLVSAGTLVVALAMGELASAFPTAGALYHWSAWLGGPGWGWFTASMNLVGQLAIVAAIDLGCAQTIAATLSWPTGASWPLLVAVLASHAVLNIFSVRIVAVLNDLSASVHIVSVAVLVGLLLALGRTHPLSWLARTGFTTRADGSYPLGFLNALILGMWTFTGFDASAHVSEETHDPARRAPWGIVWAVLVSAVAGYALVAALTLAIGDLPATAAADQPALFILRHALGEQAGRAAMGLAILAMWFCGLSSVTSASRMLFAFARDEGLPLHARLKVVSPRLRTPHVAILAVCGASFALVVATASLSDAAFLAVASLATTGLYTSYATPIALGAIARARGRWTRLGPWNLGRLGQVTAWGATAWSAFVLVVCALPPNAVAGGMIAGTVVGLALFYLLVVRGRFRGPSLDLRAIEEREARKVR